MARQRQDFLHQTSAGLVKRFGALGTEVLAVQNMVKRGGAHKKGLNREIHAASPAAFLTMIRTKAGRLGPGMRKPRRGRSNPRNAVMRAGDCRTRRKNSRTGSTSARIAVSPAAAMTMRLWFCCGGLK
ncbi:MAG: hypothetical protein ACYDEV_00820 [Acidiferrobacter sp.]